MGNARSSLDGLVFFRAWTAAEVKEVQETLRRRKTTMAVDRATFDELVSSRNPGCLTVFHSLDSDFDGKVDTFEMLLTLTLWSCATWEEKLELLFQCFDFNHKGVLRFPELAFMVSTAARVMDRFAEVPAGMSDPAALRDEAATAFGGARSGEIGAGRFAEWFGGSSIAQQLREFVNAHLSVEAPEAVESMVRERLRLLEYRVQELAQEVAQMRDAATGIRGDVGRCDEDQKERCKLLWQKIDGLFTRLAVAGETQQSELAELSRSLNQEVSGGGAAALLEPATRSRHGQLLADTDALQRRARSYLDELKETLAEIVELTRGLDLAIEGAMGPPIPPPRTPNEGEDPEAAARRVRVLDREMRRARGKRPIEALVSANALPSAGIDIQPTPAAQPAPASQPGIVSQGTPEPGSIQGEPEAGAEEPMPVVVAFAAFDPPPSSDTQMLSLQPGDEIVALGQDGQGWWYGRKVDGVEGWFPPSYVQVKDEAAGAAVAEMA